MGLPETFFILLLLIVAAVLAGIVLLVSWVSKGKRSAGTRQVACLHCGATQLRDNVQCIRCLAPLVSAKGDLRRGDLVATARELKRMLRGKVIDTAQHNELVARLRKEYQRVSSSPEHDLPAAMALVEAAAAEKQSAPPAPAKSSPLAEKPVKESPANKSSVETQAEPKEETSSAVPPPPPADEHETLEAEVIDAEVVQPKADPAPSRPREKFADVEPAAWEPKPPVATPQPRREEKVHPLDRPSRPEPPRQPSQARQSMADVFSAFMEDKNIRWGELLSGLLIVGSTIGLIVSLGDELKWLPYDKALLAMLVTLAIFLSGVYTFKHWKLATTSRGLLIIALLLVPLNFMAALVQPNDSHSIPLYLTAVAVGLSLFGWIVYRSSHILSPEHWPWLAGGLAAPIASMMLLDRIDPAWFGPWLTTGLMLPTTGALVAVAYRAMHAPLKVPADQPEPATGTSYLQPLYLLVGIPLFAVLCSLGFYLYANRGSSISSAVSLAATVSLLSSTLLALGIAMIGRSSQSKQAAELLTGPVMALLGTCGVIGSLAVAAIDPLLLMVLASVQALLLGVLAWREKSVAMGYAAVGSLSLAYLTTSGLVLGLVPLEDNDTRLWLLDLFQSGPMAVALTLWAIALAGAGLGGQRRQATGLAQVCLHSAMVLVGLSLLTAGAVSMLQPTEATYTTCLLAAYALIGLIGGSVTLRQELSAAGVVFAALALGNSLLFEQLMAAWPIADRLALVGCGYATFMLLWRVVEVAVPRSDRQTAVRTDQQHPLLLAVIVATLFSLPVVFYLGSLDLDSAINYLAWLTALWLAMSLLLESPLHFLATRALVTVTVGYAALAVTGRWNPQLDSIWTLTHLLNLTIALSGLSLLWMSLEATGRRVARLDHLLGKPGQLERDLFHYMALAGIVCVAMSLTGMGIEAELNLSGDASGRAASPASYAGGFWLAWVLLTGALAGRAVISLRCQSAESDHALLTPRTRAMLVFLGASALLPIAIALHAHADLAMATALRWCFALYALLAAGGVALAQSRRTTFDGESLAGRLSDPLLALGAIPVCGITLLALGALLAGQSPAGPLESSWLAVGPLVSYLVPLGMVVGAMVLHAIALRRPRNMALGSLTLQAALVLGCSVQAQLSGAAYDAAFLIGLLQASAIALALYGFLWLAISKYYWREESESLLEGHVAVAIAVSSCFALWITLSQFLSPEATSSVGLLGSWPSWLAVALTASLSLVSGRPAASNRETMLQWSAFSAIALTAAVAASRIPPLGSAWIGTHVIQVGLLLMAFVSMGRSIWSHSQHRKLMAATVTGLVIVTLAFALRGAFDDPLSPEWQVGVIVVSLIPLAWLGMVRRDQYYAYGTTLLAAAIPIAGNLQASSAETFWLSGFLALTAGAVAALAWALMEIGYQRRQQESLDESMPVAVHRFYGWLLLIGTAVGILLAHVGFSLFSGEGIRTGWLPMGTAACLVMLLLLPLASLWDRKANCSLQILHMAGGIWLVWGLIMLDLPGQDAFLWLMVSLTVYQTLIAWLSRRPLLIAGRQLSLPRWDVRHASFRKWLLGTSMASTAVLLPFCVVGVLNYSQRGQVILCGMLPALLALQALLQIDNARRVWLRGAVLLLGVTAAVLLSWGDLHDTELPLTSAWLLRMIRTVIVTAAMAFLLGVAGARRLTAENPWRAVLARGATACMGAAVILLLPILATEISVFDRASGLPIDDLHAAAVAVSLVGMMITLFVFALSRGLDPLELGEQQKQLYIYGAEAVMVLIGGQLYLMLPGLFGGAFREYWPLVVMLVAFLGVGVSELARRNQNRVLAEPFYHTSLLLPALPALGYWLLDTNVSYSFTMLAAGALYAMLALTRRSPLSTVAAILSGNIAFWAMMHENSVPLLQNPQFWLIPPAASVLIAAQYQRKKLSEGQLATIRYLSMLVIYLSSMAEVFIRGIGQEWWPPMLLATLAVAGALLGVALRVRAFLYTGTSFLAFAMFSMVWHVYRQLGHAAVWWVFGITLGVLILLLFAMFEKNREQLQGWIRKVQQWER